MPDTPDLAAQWKKFTPEQRASALAKMTLEQKQKLKATLSAQPSAAAAAPAPADPTAGKPMVLAEDRTPSNARFPSLKGNEYQYLDWIASQLPAAGAAAGGVAGEGLASAPLAAAGALGGVAAKDLAHRALYTPPIPFKSWDAAQTDEGKSARNREMLEQGTIAALTEGIGGIATRMIGRIAAPFEASAQTVKDAEAGRGMRLTPGEATGNEKLMSLESVIGHLPGGGGPMGAFRAAQAGDEMRLFDKQLKAISARGLSGEEAGEAVQKAVKDLENARDARVDERFDEARSILGKKPGEALTSEDFLNALGEERVNPERVGKNTQGAVAKAKDASTKAVDAKYDDFKESVGRRRGEFLNRQQMRKALRDHENPKPNLVLDKDGNPVPAPRPGPEAREKLLAAHKLFRDETARWNQEIFGHVLATQKPELIAAYVGKTAGLDDLRALNKIMPEAVKKDLARNVLQDMLDKSRASGALDAKTLSRSLANLGEDKGKLIFGEAKWEQLQDVSRLFKQKSAGNKVLDSLFGDARDPVTGKIDGNKLGNALRDLGEKRGRALFGAHYDAILDTARTLKSNKPDTELFAKILATNDPEKIAAHLPEASLEDLRKFNYAMPPEARQDAAANVFENMIQTSRNPQTDKVEALSLSKQLQRMGPARGRLIYGDQYPKVVEISKLLDRVNHGNGGIVARMADHRIVAAGAIMLASVAGLGPVKSAIAGASAVATEVAFAKLMSAAIANPATTAKALGVARWMAAAASRAPLAAADNLIFDDSPARYDRQALPDYTKVTSAP